VPCGRVNTVADLLADPHLRVRQAIVGVEDLAMAAAPRKGPGVTTATTTAPVLGAQTDEILREVLSLDPARIRPLRTAGAVA